MKALLVVFLIFALTLLSGGVFATALVLSKTPLYGVSHIQPNVLFLLDDSWRMYFKVSKTQGVQELENYIRTESGDAGFSFDEERSTAGRWALNVNLNTSSTIAMNDYLSLCPGFNALAYDPHTTYTPWATYDDAIYSDGMWKHPDVDPDANSSIFTGIYSGDSSATNITTAKYVIWNDDGDGIYEHGECGLIPGEENITTHSGVVTDIALSSGDYKSSYLVTVQADEYQNYANWYTYYRSRDFIFKRALSEVFSSLQTRAALATINGNAGKGWAMEMGDVRTPATKTELMNTLFSLNNERGSNTRKLPLRRALQNAGRYFWQNKTSAMDDNFVAEHASEADDPIEYSYVSCQQNHTILATNGYNNQSLKGFNQGDSRYDTLQPHWGEYGNADGDVGGVYADDLSGTLADVAIYFYQMDMRPSVANDVTANNPLGDPNPDNSAAQHMTTHTLSFGIAGSITGQPDETVTSGYDYWPLASHLEDKYVDFNQGNDEIIDDFLSVAVPGQDLSTSGGANVLTIPDKSAESLDDLIHASYNGRGEYINASNYETLLSSLNRLVSSINASSEAAGAGVGFNSTSITSDSTLYHATFDPVTWTGTLSAVDYADGDIGRADWQAGAVLDTAVASGDKRSVITFNGIAGVPFVAPAAPAPAGDYSALTASDISAAMVNDLLVEAPLLADEKQAYLEDIIGHLRGDGVLSADRNFRDRASLLGDIVHSSPQYVAAPSDNYPNYLEGSGDSEQYFHFMRDKSSRTPMVYVGANDGMLHAFNANNGSEVFAYIPQAVTSTEYIEGLHHLASSSYSHVPYVDASPTVADVFINGDWKSYLVGGLGRGGKAVYVLDITDPASYSGTDVEESLASHVVVTEFTDAYLGYTFSRPRIAKMNDGEWVAIFGNGYGNDTDGGAYLYVLYLDGSGPGGESYKKIGPLGGLGMVADGSCESLASDCNGLSSPTLIDLNGDSKVDRVYAGDLHGNMWAFDFTQFDSLLSTAIEPAVAHVNDDGVSVPMFTACRGAVIGTAYCAPADRQPITHKPVVVGHAGKHSLSTEPNLMVLFGSGRYATADDYSNTDLQSFYAVWDAGSRYGELRSEDLTQQIFSTDSSSGTRTIASVADVDYVETERLDDDGASLVERNFGWYMNLTASGERVVVEPSVAGNVLVIATTIPAATECNVTDGSGYVMAVNLYTGVQPGFDVFTSVAGNIVGVATTEMPGGLVILNDRIVMSVASGDISSERAIFEPLRPTRRSAWSIIN